MGLGFEKCEFQAKQWDWYPGYSGKNYPSTLKWMPEYFVDGLHYIDVIMSVIASKITGVSIVYSTGCLGGDQRKHQSSAPLKIFHFDDVIAVNWLKAFRAEHTVFVIMITTLYFIILILFYHI